ncbi:MAG: hypothetical protein Q7N50_14895, partial [Armatimonadota bacterium]|nr:hypothetical protein [Armatimonadota bacterium]
GDGEGGALVESLGTKSVSRRIERTAKVSGKGFPELTNNECTIIESSAHIHPIVAFYCSIG